MTVIEFALIRLRGDYDELELYEALMQCLEVQDEWVRNHQPHLLKQTKHSGNLSSLYIAKTNPPYLLITAPWDSPDAHNEWIKSEENQSGMADLAKYIDSGDDAVILFHMKPAGKQTGPPPMFMNHETFDVDRIFIEPGEKDTVQAKYHKLEGAMLELKIEDRLWGGWRIEKDGDAEELVVFSSHTNCPLDKAVQKLGLTQTTESRCFHHIT